LKHALALAFTVAWASCGSVEKNIERQDAEDAKRRDGKRIRLSLLSYLGVLGVLAFNNECFQQNRVSPHACGLELGN
jgi:hypothetical protein